MKVVTNICWQMFGNSYMLASEQKRKPLFWQSKDDEDIMATFFLCFADRASQYIYLSN